MYDRFSAHVGANKENVAQSKKRGAITSVIVANILIKT